VLEGKWTQIAQQREGIKRLDLEELINKSTCDNFKLYEQLATILYKPLVHINDMTGGLIKLGWACQPNNIYEPSRLVLYVDNLLTYGTNYNIEHVNAS